MDSEDRKAEVNSAESADEETRLRERSKQRQTLRKSEPETQAEQPTEGRVENPADRADETAATTTSCTEGATTSTQDRTGEDADSQHQTASASASASASAGSKASGSLESKYSEPGGTGRSTGKKRKRERRRMNRDAQRKGEPLPFSRRGQSRDTSRGSGSGSGSYRGDWGGRSDRHYRDRPPHSDWRGPPPPDWRGPPPDHYRNEYDYSDYRARGRSPRRSHSRSRSRSRPRTPSSVSSHSEHSRSHSHSRSRSGSRSQSYRSRSEHGSRSSKRRSSHSGTREESRRSGGNGEGRRRSGSGSRSRGKYSNGRPDSRERRRSHSPSSYSESSSSSSEDENDVHQDESAFSKDQRTVFVTQLVLRATEKDIRRYFRRKVGCKVKEVILLRDKRTGSHKGCAYVQMGRIDDVNNAVSVAGQPPDFQRFPILVKASEAEKNYAIPASSSVVTASMMGKSSSSSPMLSKDGKIMEAQKAYVGSLDPSVNEEHLFALFSQFGQLEKVSMQMDPATQTSRGYAFLSFRDPKEANLAIQTMSNQVLAGRPMKTGWANQSPSIPGVMLTTSDEFPADANIRAQKAFSVLAQLTGTSPSALASASISSTAEKAIEAAMGGATDGGGLPGSAVPTVAEARASLAAEQASVAPESVTASTGSQSSIVGGGKPTNFLLVHNMFDKDEETESGWEKDIKEEFEEECSKFGKINSVIVMSKEPGGKIYASFDSVDSAEACATNLAGRWFDKRQLRVEYIQESDFPKND